MTRHRRKSSVKKPHRNPLQAARKMSGRLELHSEGYGFLLPDEKGEKDVFIPAPYTGGAMNGDRVEAAIHSRSGRRKSEGRIVKILERTQTHLVGTFEITPKGFSVICQNGRTFLRVKIPPDKALKAMADQAVVVQITQYPQGDQPLLGEVVRLLGSRKEPQTETEIIIVEHQLKTEFPQKVTQEAQAYPKEVSSEESAQRRDLRSFPLITIDGENARDFDDGILVERTREGYKLYVAIADVSHYVRPHSAIDREALDRSTSTYFPDRCIPMLPEELSNHLCSLVPHQDRLSFVAEMDFDRQGRRVGARFYKAVIQSASRQTYTKIHRMMIEGDSDLRKEYSSLLPHLEAAFELFEEMRARRLERGSIDFDLPEPQIVLDMEEGIATSIVKSSRTKAHMLIEEFMVAANEAVAEFMEERKLPSIYRIHETPDPEKLSDFKILAHNLGHPLPSVERIRPKDLAQLVQDVKGKPHERLVNTLLLRSLKQALYATENAGHYGLASKSYTHFTSPIRRYPDLIIHRLLFEALDSDSKKKGKRDDGKKLERLAEMAAHCSKMERRSMKAEWAVRDLHVALFMKDKVGEEYEGVISSVTKFGFFVELLTYFVEGLVSLTTLVDDSFEFIETRHELRGHRTKKVFRIGETVRVKVVRVDIEKRRLDFVLV